MWNPFAAVKSDYRGRIGKDWMNPPGKGSRNFLLEGFNDRCGAACGEEGGLWI
jgi:hypothetical protein